MSVLGYDTGASRGGGRGGGRGLGKAFGIAPNPIHWLISESAAQSITISITHRGSGGGRQHHRTTYSKHHTVSQNSTQHPTSVGLYQNHTPSISITCKESGEGTQSHLFKVLSCLFLNIVVNYQAILCEPFLLV